MKENKYLGIKKREKMGNSSFEIKQVLEKNGKHIRFRNYLNGGRRNFNFNYFSELGNNP